jgi:dTDP-4-dehydrorhamnose reductase
MSQTSGNGVELVVGADSMIGKALLEDLRRSGRPALGTTRRRDGASRDTLYLDLAQFPDDWQCPPVSVAYVCAAVARIEACWRDPAGSARVNVQGTSRIISRLVSQGAFVVFLSTNQVFDGSKAQRRTDEPTCPRTEYGRQKAEAERLALAAGPRVAVVRLTKVFGENIPLFAGWAEALRRGEEIRPLADMWMAPVPVSCVVSALRRVGEQQRSGTIHVSGARDLSYSEAACLGARALGERITLIRPMTAREAGLPGEPPPRHTTLETETLWQSCGIAVPPVEWTVRTAFASPGVFGLRSASAVGSTPGPDSLGVLGRDGGTVTKRAA